MSGKRALSSAVRPALRELLARVLSDFGVEDGVSVVFVDDATIRDLHREFFGKDSATDVVTFPLRGDSADEPAALGAEGSERPPGADWIGEVIVSVDTARRESARRGLSLDRELSLYALHGVLHLVGLDDIDPDDRRRMRRAERKYLAGFGH